MTETRLLSEKRIDFLNILQLLARKLHWILLCGILCGSVLYLIAAFLISPQYRAYITMYVYNNPNASDQSSVSNADLQASENLAETYIEILQSNRILNSVMEALPSDVQLSRNEIKKMLSITTVNGTQLLKLSVTCKDPQISYEVAEAFAKLGPEEIMEITKVGSAEIVDHAELNPSAVSPDITRYTVSGFLGGVLAAVLFFLFKAWTDYTLYNAGDVEKATGLIVLGQIPEIEPHETYMEYRKLVPGGRIIYEKEKEKETADEPVG